MHALGLRHRRSLHDLANNGHCRMLPSAPRTASASGVAISVLIPHGLLSHCVRFYPPVARRTATLVTDLQATLWSGGNCTRSVEIRGFTDSPSDPPPPDFPQRDRGLLSIHSRYGLHTRQVTFMTLYTGGFSRFVTFTTAPIATGWNESCRAGFAPAGKPCLCTAHTIKDVIIRCGRWNRV